MAEIVTALAGKAAVRADGIAIVERPPLAMVQVVAFPESAATLRAVLAGALGLSPPIEPNTTASGPRATILWLGPDRWLVVEPRDSAATRWHAAIVAAGGILTDLGHGRTAIRISGRRARETLEKGVGPDLHPRAFPPGACLQTNVAHTNVLLHAVDNVPSFDLYVLRSYAADFWDWLCDAAGSGPAG